MKGATLAFGAAVCLALGCQGSGRQEQSLQISDEQIIAAKPAGTNALIFRLTKTGGRGSATAPAGVEFECISFEEGGSQHAGLCWAYVDAARFPTLWLTFVPDPDSAFLGWSGGPCSGSTCEILMDRDRSVAVSYGRAPPAPPPDSFRLTVAVPGPVRLEPTITATPDIGLSCAPFESGNYAYLCSMVVPNTTPPKTVTLVADYPSPEYQFAGWGGACSGSTCTVTVSQDTHVTATWVRRNAGEPQNAPVVTISPISFEGTLSTTEYVRFNYTSSIPGVTWACYVTDPVYGESLVANPCYPPLTMGFRDGENTLTISATTSDGITGSASYTFIQQTAPLGPVVTISPISFEGTLSTTEYVRFNYTSSIPGVTWACYVTDPVYGESLVASPCYPPLTMGFRDGENTLTITATTSDGVTGSASYTFIQQTAPLVCAAGLGNCDGNSANGCEVSMLSDAANCGACGTTCASGKLCVNGACTLSVLGSGTPSDPYRAPNAVPSCRAYVEGGMSRGDGAYLLGGSSIVYCDMTTDGGGWTYEGFGFGPYTGSFPGYQWVGASEFGTSAALQAAFVLHYNRLGGIPNLSPGWRSSNCCFVNPGAWVENTRPTTPSPYFGFAGSSYMYPSTFSGAMACNDTYQDSIIKLYLFGQGITKSTFTQTEVANVVVSNACGIANNPAIFVRKYR